MKIRAVPFQAITALVGAFFILPLRFALLPLLIVLPGLCLYAIYTDLKGIDPLEAIGYSLTVSLIIVPLIASLLLVGRIDVSLTRMAIGFLIIILSMVSYLYNSKSKDASNDRPKIREDSGKYYLKQLVVIAVSLALAVIIFVTLSQSLTVTSEGLAMHQTYASDVNFHFSIISRFIQSPHIPVEDPYLPGYYVNYNWFMHVYFGTLSILTGVHQFTLFKIIFPILFFATSINVFLLARRIFDYASALTATIVYALGGGFAWAIIAYLRPTDLFHYLIYQFGNTAEVKYDQTILFYLLPQTQSFALVILIFALFLWTKILNNYDLKSMVVLSVILMALPYYHLITAFPLFLSMAFFTLYKYVRRNTRDAYSTAIPLIAATFLTIPQLLLLLGDQPSQFTIRFLNYTPAFMFIIYGLIGILALIGAYKSLKSREASPLLFFAVITFLIMNVIALPLTHNTYRFLVYLYVPIAVFASCYIAQTFRELKARRRASKITINKATAIVLALLCALPTSFMLIAFFNANRYTHIGSAELKAMDWIKSNTSRDSIFLEEPSTFPKIPLETGRRLAFAGGLYTVQYHGIDKYEELNNVLNEEHSNVLSALLKNLNVSYVFIGQNERSYIISSTVDDPNYFEKMYDAEMVMIYRVK